ncbi:hypothetical protein [Paenibacillus taichungensis]
MSEVFDSKIAEFNEKPKMVQYRILAQAEASFQEEKKLQPVREYFNNDPKKIVLEIVNVTDKYQIAKVKHKRNRGEPAEILYHVFIDFKRINECAYSLDSALLVAITHNHNAGSAAGWIENMIGMKYVPEVE